MVRFPFYGCGRRKEPLSTMLMLAGFGLYTMEDFSLNSWLILLKILSVILFIYLTIRRVPRIDAGGFQG